MYLCKLNAMYTEYLWYVIGGVMLCVISNTGIISVFTNYNWDIICIRHNYLKNVDKFLTALMDLELYHWMGYFVICMHI